MSMPSNLKFTLYFIATSFTLTLSAAEPGITHTFVFPREKGIHNHAPCVTECPNGDLLLAYYTGHGERSSDDVRIVGHRLVKGEKAWSPRMELADTPGYPRLQPCPFCRTQWRTLAMVSDHSRPSLGRRPT